MLTEDPERLLTTEECARLIGVTPAALKARRFRNSAPPAIQLAGTRSIRYRVRDVLHWIDSAAAEHQDEAAA